MRFYRDNNFIQTEQYSFICIYIRKYYNTHTYNDICLLYIICIVSSYIIY